MKVKYLIIDEDGLAYGKNELTEEIHEAFDAGLVSVIDIENLKTLEDYYSDSWEDIEIN